MLRRVLSLPPHILWQKVRRRAARQVRQTMVRQRARWLPTQVSDAEFTQALTPAFPTAAAFLEHLPRRTQPHFFFSAPDRPALLAALLQIDPASQARIVAAADQACAHRFDLLGSGSSLLGTPIDWHADFKSGHRWDARQFYADVRSAPAPGGYDLKVPWELSRCQHFAWLGQAYWFTGDEKYAREFVAQVKDWIAHNPPLLGVNWGCAMDVAIRAVNWLWGYAFFEQSPSVTDAFRLVLFKSLLVHGRHIRNNLEFSETLTSNHYLSDIVGLVYLGVLLPEFSEAAEWRRFGLQELEREMFKQVYADGVDFEASTAYHRLATELFLSPTLLAQRNGHRFSAAYLQRLEGMLDFIRAATRPDGRLPLIGDNDNGRLHRLKVWDPAEHEWSDYRYLLAMGALLFDRADFAQVAGDQWEEALWFWGAPAVQARLSAPAEATERTAVASQAFAEAGLFIMRHDDLYLLVDAGSNGQKGNGGHAHNDLLSFELHAAGQPWLVDPGVYVYTADHAARNLLRSTAYHNTVQVDHLEQHPFVAESLFRLGSDTQPTVHAWVTEADYDFLDVSHSAYARLTQPVVHRRQILLDKRQRLWLIRDQLTGSGQHRLDWHWRWAPGITCTLADDNIVATAPGGEQLQMRCIEGSLAGAMLTEGWVAPGYGQRLSAPVVQWQQVVATWPVIQTLVLAPIAPSRGIEPAQIAVAHEQMLRFSHL